MQLYKLKKQYDFACNEYVNKFCNKQGLDFRYWLGSKVGSIACCGGFYFKMEDIILDINSHQPKGLIMKWQEEDAKISYYAFTCGHKIREEALAEMEASLRKNHVEMLSELVKNEIKKKIG